MGSLWHSPGYMKEVAFEQELFHKGRQLGSSPKVRPEILASWQRSKGYLAIPSPDRGKPLPQEKLEQTLQSNKELINSALPVIEQLKATLKSSSSMIILADKNGVVLHINGDDSVRARMPNLIPGAVVTENEVGTNSIGLCLALQKPVEVFGPEHYSFSDNEWCCISAPLRGGRQRIMGVLTIILPLTEYHAHTSGMLTMAAKDINDQHHLHDLLSDQEAILELTGIGVLVLDKLGGIKAANSKGRAMFRIPPAPERLGSISDVLASPEPFLTMLASKKCVMDREVFLHLQDDEHLHCMFSALPIPNDKGIVVSLYETNRAQRLAAYSVGARAIYTFESIIGGSSQIQKAVELSRVASHSDITTLILGESGTGKELFAHAIHSGSARKSAPFVIVNCGSLPRDLIQSELFGYDSGAFTGAQKGGRAGKFELADTGTIFLDEIGDMPLEAQTNLLRLIQNGEVSRIGSKYSKHVDVRIIAATNKNLREAVRNGTFREDLFYRLSVLTIDVPPLRERPQDIAPLAEYFMQICSRSIRKATKGISPEAMRALRGYEWPGNVRELENVIERALNLAKGPHIAREDLPSYLALPYAGNEAASGPLLAGPAYSPAHSPACPPAQQPAQLPTYLSTPLPAPASLPEPSPARSKTTQPGRRTLKAKEADFLFETLRDCNGNIRMAAQILGIARSTLYTKLKKGGYEVHDFRQ